MDKSTQIRCPKCGRSIDILAHQWETEINRNTSLDYVLGISYIEK